MARSLEERVAAIEERNKRVGLDKAWETSWFRRVTISAFTYVTVVAYLHFVVHISPWINALVPVIGYFLSTITIQKLKRWWISRQ